MLEGPDPHGSLVGATLGNYQVTGRIGAGGMGVVYRAHDARLDRTVAVKALPESAGSDPVARKKLMDEARRASRVVSPYVATVFDVVEQDDRAYIVMEYIEGRRLDVVLDEDRPGAAAVTACAVEIAEALTAIHGAGLVHRDLKPANVMVTPAGHVKVMDFGLARDDVAAALRNARAESTLSTQTGPGGIAGTILYMSPEQVRGEPLDARSDLFSFGTLLYEALTGRHPFERESLLASASAILNEAPAGVPDPPKLASSHVGTIVHRLLEKKRESRYPSAELVLEDLRAARSGAPISPEPIKPAPRRRLGVLAAGAAALVTLALVLYALWPPRPPGVGAGSRPVLAVLPFEDRTGEPRGDLRAQLLADLLATDLTESSLVRALPSDRVREILLGVGAQAPRPAMLAAVVKAADVRWIVAGTLYKENDALYASVAAYPPGEPEPSVTFRAAAGTTAAIAELASVQLRERLFPDLKDALPAGRTGPAGGSNSEEAQFLEQEARKAVRELRYGRAIENLEKAVRIDPGFLSAQIHLAEALDRAGYATRARETADRALRTVEQLGDAARGESLVLEARAVHARIHDNANGEIAARSALVAKHGDDPTAHLELARALDRRGRSTEALPEADLAIALDAKDPGAHLTKARMLFRAKRFDEASAALDRAEALFAAAGSVVGRAAIERTRADSEFARARYPAAEALYQKAARSLAAAGFDTLAAQSRKSAGDCELMQGNLEAAVATYEPALAAAQSAGDHRMIVNTLSSLGGRYLIGGNLEKAERVLREARDEALGLGNPTLLAGPTLNLASVLDSSGQRGESRALSEEALAMARDVGDYQIQAKALLLLANAQYSDGRLDDAMRSYREVRDSAQLANAPGTPLGNVHLGLAQILRETGRLKEAVASAEQAVAVNRTANQRVLLGLSLVARARIRAELGLDADAESDLDEAERVASDPAPPLDDLMRNVGPGRAILATTRSRWDDAERVLGPLRQGIEPEHGVGLDALVLAMSAQVAIERGRVQDAIRYAGGAVSSAAGSPVDRAQARIQLARAHARTGKKAEASSGARRALDEADRMGVPILTALACAVLVELGASGDTEALRARGRAAIERYLDAAPEQRRDAVLARNDIHGMVRIFEGVAASNNSR